jgi:hypothetical protein
MEFSAEISSLSMVVRSSADAIGASASAAPAAKLPGDFANVHSYAPLFISAGGRLRTAKGPPSDAAEKPERSLTINYDLR